MGRSFNAARFPMGTAPNTLAIAPTAGQTFKIHALVVLDGNGTLVECGANPAKVLGVSGNAAFIGYGLNLADTTASTIITGSGFKSQAVSVMVADRETIFSCRGINGATDPLTPTLAMKGVKYGVAKVGNDWVLNQADTTNVVVQVVDVEISNKVFFVKFLESVLNLA